jgi:hypothetical protein
MNQISVVIATLDDERALGRTLVALVPALVDGLVREVIVADGGSVDRTLEVAEDAGVRVIACQGSVEARRAVGAQAAKGDWLLLLSLNRPVADGWAAAVDEHVRRFPGQPAWWSAGGGLFGGKPQGMLAPKAMAGAKKGRRLKLYR